jgi:hypothetical protein
MRIAAALCALAAALVVAGCGGGGSNGEASEKPARVLQDVKAAALDAGTVHISGRIYDNGTPLNLDLSLVRKKGGHGTIAEGPIRLEVLRIGKTVYIKANAGFLQRFAGAAGALLKGRWLKGPTTGRFAQLVPFTDLASLLQQSVSNHKTLVNEGETTFNGQKAVGIRDTSDGSTLFVAASGPPYPVGAQDGTGKGKIVFDRWGEDVSLVAPKGAVDISKLGG